ncbi:MAG: ion transporter [Chlorobi bacterium]|nr:ion transporter [Chlorobiota bacterium]
MTVRHRLWHILNGTPSDTIGRAIDIALACLIITNVIAGIIETVGAIHERWGKQLWWFDAASVAVFTIEYLLRLWSCTADHRYRRPFVGRLRCALTPLSIVDVLAIAPFYLQLLMPGVDLRVLRVLRLVFRLLRFVRYSHSLSILVAVAKSERREIGMSLVVHGIVVVFASTAMYYIEHPYQPENFADVPSAMWWAIITLTTVGYGDIYPITPLGKVVGGLVALMGIGLVALPTAILSAGFLRELQRRHRRHLHTCPHCGTTFEEHH